MGGFTSTAPILAGQLRKIPTFVHESNAIPGKANRLNARMCDAVLLGFEDCARYFPSSRCEVTGTPIRRSLSQRVPREEALAAFGLNPERKTLLIMGGSQGAHGINEAADQGAAALKELPVQVIHLTGPNDDQVAAANYRREEIPAHVAPFCHRMEAGLQRGRSCALPLRCGEPLGAFAFRHSLAADPVSLRGGESPGAERRNLRAERRGGRARSRRSHRGNVRAEMARWLLDDSATLQKMSEQSRALAPKDAAAQVADVLERSANGGKNSAKSRE